MCHKCQKQLSHIGKNGSHSKNVSHCKKWVTFEKMDHIRKMGNTVRICVTLCKTGSYLKKMSSPAKRGSNLEKWVTLWRIAMWKRVTQWKWVTIGQICHTVKYGIYFKKWVVLWKMGNIWQNGSNCEMAHICNNRSHYKNEPHCKK